MTSRSDRAQPHTPCICTRSQFARRAKRAPASITEAAQDGGPLAGARLPNGRLDAASPAAVAWAVKRGIDPASLLDPAAFAVVAEPIEVPGAIDTDPAAARSSMRGRGRPKAGQAPTTASDTEHSVPRDVTDLLSCTLRELTTRHGSAQGFADWLDTRKVIAETARLESRNDRDEGRLISSEFVKLHVFGLLDAQNRRLLTNAPRTISVRALSAARNGGTLEELRVLIASAISTELRVSKEKIRREIRACKTGDNPPELSPPSTEEHSFEEIRSFARDVQALLCTDFLPVAVDFLLKEIVRAAAGGTWDAAMAGEAMATKATLVPEATRVLGNMLEAHIQNAITEAVNQERSQ